MIEIIKKHPWFHILFLVVVIAEILGLTVNPQIRLASKGMIMATLMGFYIFSVRKQSHTFILGMIFALLGDAFLLFTTDTFFIIGLGCFLVMQLLYAYTFWQKRRIPKTKDKFVIVSLLILPTVFLYFSWTSLADMKWAVVLYGISITIMLATAYLRHSKLRGYRMVLFGSVLFVLSDLLIGITKFLTKISYEEILIMVLYILAQYLIVLGIIYDERPKKEIPPVIQGAFGRHKI